MKLELPPGEDLEEFIERAVAAGQGEEGVGQLGHEGLAVVHALDDVQLGELLVGELAFDERLRDDADGFAAGVAHGVGENAHEADVPGAEDQADAAPGQERAEPARFFGVNRRGAGA